MGYLDYEAVDKCEICKEVSNNISFCIKCGRFTCSNCVEVHISDWECVCDDCGW